MIGGLSMNQDIREENYQNKNDKKHNLRKSWILVLIICLIVRLCHLI